MFEVAPEADAEFVAGWANSAALVLRALRGDVAFRFVAIGELAAAEPAATALYDVARLDGTPDVAGGVVAVTPFEVPAGDEEGFLAGWDAARAVFADQQGYLGTRLHGSDDPGARFRFVAVARWSSPLMVARASRRPAFAAAAEAIPFASHPALYLPAGR
jgi:heme-degrading monooxygenase HmoA